MALSFQSSATHCSRAATRSCATAATARSMAVPPPWGKAGGGWHARRGNERGCGGAVDAVGVNAWRRCEWNRGGGVNAWRRCEWNRGGGVNRGAAAVAIHAVRSRLRRRLPAGRAPR
eukprot:scaffold532_cov99-Isochrysis_galbana.AAC.2